jgi:hypothetical protein
VVVVGDFDAVEVCCETAVACVELEVCDCVVSVFVFVVFPCGFDVLPLSCWMGRRLPGRISVVFLCFISLFIVSKWVFFNTNFINQRLATCWTV